jgi:L-cystine transport system substrate-binding protein
MMKTGKLWLAVGAVAVLFSAGINLTNEANAADVRKVIVAAPDGGYPLYFTDDKGVFTGFDVEVLRKIDELLPEYEFVFKPTEFKALFPGLEAEKLDIITGNLNRTAERDAKFLHTTKAYSASGHRFLVAEKNNSVHSLADLEGKKLGVSEGSLQAGIIERYIKQNNSKIQIVYTFDYAQFLATGRVDAIISPEVKIQALNKQFENFKVKPIGEPLEDLLRKEGKDVDPNVYFWFSKKEEKLKNDVSAAIWKLRQDGTLSALSKQWYGDDYPANIDPSKESK